MSEYGRKIKVIIEEANGSASSSIKETFNWGRPMEIMKLLFFFGLKRKYFNSGNIFNWTSDFNEEKWKRKIRGD